MKNTGIVQRRIPASAMSDSTPPVQTCWREA